jgi:hypothetical protein
MSEHETAESGPGPEKAEFPTPQNLAEAKALQRFQQGEAFGAASAAQGEKLRNDQAQREADARANLEAAKADPNIISEIPKFDTPESDQ